jgi:hypothetical protein
VNTSSAYRNSNDVLPTPLSPMSSSLKLYSAGLPFKLLFGLLNADTDGMLFDIRAVH